MDPESPNGAGAERLAPALAAGADPQAPAGAHGSGRAEQLVQCLQLQPHPEGGFYREVFRSPHAVMPSDGRPSRSALTTIDFLLLPGQFSAWHRVGSDEVWHWLEGGPLRLWLLAPEHDRIDTVTLGPVATVASGTRPRHVVPAGWWQAAEPLGDFVYCGATVGPGFDFADFDFLRADAAAAAALAALDAGAQRLL